MTAKHHEIKPNIRAGHVSELVRQAMLNHFGIQAYTGGYKVYTTINSTNQDHATQSIQQGLIKYDSQQNYRQLMENLNKRFGDQPDIWLAHIQSIPLIAGLMPAVVLSTNPLDIQVLLPNGRTPIVTSQQLHWIAKNEPYDYNPEDYFSRGDLIFLNTSTSGELYLAQYPEIEGALVDLNPITGAVQCLVGGFDYSLSHFNRVTQAMRQPGSVLKPFIYMAGLEQGLTLATVINDAPIVKKDSGLNETWRPNNVSHYFYGPTRLRIGLIKSRNIISVRLLEKIGIDYARDFLQRFGFESANQPRALSMALGAGVVSPLQMAQGYAAIANGGVRVHPYLIDHVEDNNGHTVLKGPLLPLDHPRPYVLLPQQKNYFQPVQIVSKSVAYLMHQVLKDVIIHGTGRALQALNRSDIAGKTGTTNQQQDTWFAGYGGQHVVVVWSGFDQAHSTHAYGSQLALPIWRNFMQYALNNEPLNHHLQPDDIVYARIDPKTGLLASAKQKYAIYELFRKQYLPQNQVALKDKVAINEDANPILDEHLF